MSRRASELPTFIAPMLAKPGQAFDSDDYLYEIKWDGTRILAFVDESGYRLVNRRRAVATGRYPELSFFDQLPRGTVLDGEIVVLREGKSQFSLLMAREHARSEMKVRNLARSLPATYMAFDLLYDGYRALMAESLHVRRERLGSIVKKINRPELVLSEGFIGNGKAIFEEVAKLGLEGMIAKRLDSRYLPGQRTDAWIKVKKGETVCCAIIGYEPEGSDDFRSLILAAEERGQLHYVGTVGTGFNAGMRKKVNAILRLHPRAKPFVPCKIKGKWIEPDYFCLVYCLERTANGTLRMPVFKELVEG